MFFTVIGWIAFVLFIVGLIVPKTILVSKKKTRKSSFIYLLIAVVCWIIGGIIGSATAKPASISPSSSAPPISAASSTVAPSSASSKPVSSSAPAAPKTISVNQTLTAGYYTVGVDFPSGTYNLTATGGSGNVITTDGAINEIMGDSGDKTFNNAKMKDGQTMLVSGVTLQITSTDASGAPLKPRNQSGLSAKQLAAGNYTAGKDFPSGTYDLTATSGQGNVICQNGLLALNAIMGTDDSTGMTTKTYKNVTFKDGNILQITGVTISITPSK